MKFLYFFFNDAATTEIYTLSLHDALPIRCSSPATPGIAHGLASVSSSRRYRSEEHTSELQSRENIVCRLLLEKKKTNLAGYAAIAPMEKFVKTRHEDHPTDLAVLRIALLL